MALSRHVSIGGTRSMDFRVDVHLFTLLNWQSGHDFNSQFRRITSMTDSPRIMLWVKYGFCKRGDGSCPLINHEAHKDELNHEGHEEHEAKNYFVSFSFVSFVSFVVSSVFVAFVATELRFFTWGS